LLSVLCLILLSGPARAQSVEPAVTIEPAVISGPYDLSYVGEIKQHTAIYEDTFVQLARDNNLGFVELRSANPHVDPWMPGAGTEIVLPTQHLLPKAPRRGIVINLPEQRLYYFGDGTGAPVTHPIGVGREGLSTPLGTTKIVRKKIGPIWRPTPRMRAEDPKLPEEIGPGRDNPMGTHAMYLGWAEYAIHGTNKPYGIGRRSSSGCIRMYPEDIVTMFDLVPEGTQVTVVDQPVKAAWIGDELYMEAHPSMDQAFDAEENGSVSTYEFTGDDMAQVMSEAGQYAGMIDWDIVRAAIRERRGIPILIAVKPGAVEPVGLGPEAPAVTGNRS
jgi:L,D-transpeptidase ErfK/SrfK